MSGKQQKAQGNAVVSPPRRCRNLYDLDQWGAQAGFEVLPISSSFAGLTDRAVVCVKFCKRLWLVTGRVAARSPV
jgi:hypothetical protein